jgi:hypothetical protein
MNKKSTSVAAAAGLVLALGAPLVASIPANAATPPAAVASSSTVPPGPGAHVFAGGKLEITSSTIRGDVLTITGKSTFANKDIEVGAGAGYQAAGKVGSDGTFTATITAANGGDYSIRFGKRVTPRLFATSYEAAWGAVRVG